MSKGYLDMPTGRRYRFSLTERGEWPMTQVKNYPVQGLGADIMAIIRVLICRYLESYEKMCNTVHDSVYVDTVDPHHTMTVFHRAFKEAPAAFEKAFGLKFNLPLRCECTWGPNMKDMVPE